jgi:hypothetical protein
MNLMFLDQCFLGCTGTRFWPVSNFSEFRLRPELIKKAWPEIIKKAWPEPEICRFERDRISNVFVSNKRSLTVGRNLDYAREMYTINTSL